MKRKYEKKSFRYWNDNLKEYFYSITLYENEQPIWHTSFAKKDLSIEEILKTLEILKEYIQNEKN